VDHESNLDEANTRFAEEDTSSRSELIVADMTQSIPPGALTYRSVRRTVSNGGPHRDSDSMRMLPAVVGDENDVMAIVRSKATESTAG